MTAPVLLVSHTHWDREWYRTFEAFRSHLVDTVDRVLDQLDEDPGWSFLLDGQAIVVEDYLAVRPGAHDRLVAAVSAGRLGIGPWYVQPDSLLPSGEAHVRNLLEGRRVAQSFGGCSQVAYCPDSFGHPAQFPQLFSGFGLGPFVYWRGNGNEIDRLGPVYRWEAPDGSSVLAYCLLRGYFSAAGLPEDPSEAADALAGIVEGFGPVERAPVVCMNGVDHMYPQSQTEAAATLLAERSGAEVRRGLLDDLRELVDPEDRASFGGELVGGRLANLLPGVWSSRLGLKLADRRAERALVGWAEPWAALGRALGLTDETPSLVEARRSLLANEAHDSIGGCSQDEVHRQMVGRYAAATELADQTTQRLLERLAGLQRDRHLPWATELELAVFNPSPVTRTDVVRMPLDGFPLYGITYNDVGVHPLALAAGTVSGYEVDGRPARLVRSEDPARVRMVEDLPALDVEFVAQDVPAFGWRRCRLAHSEAHHDEIDDGRAIDDGVGLRVHADDDGTLTVEFAGRSLPGLCALEDRGDRGDTYDFDPVDDDPGAELRSVHIVRQRHASGVHRLVVTRVMAVPASLEVSRTARTAETVTCTVRIEARLVPGSGRLDLDIEVEDQARDHRLRMLFPTGHAVERFHAATTFDAAVRTTGRPEAARWWHPAPETFAHQGWVEANGLLVAAPGLPEAEVTPEGTVAVTLLRAVGWLSRLELGRRPIPAGPTLVTPDAQCPGGIAAHLAIRLLPRTGADPAAVAAAAAADELGLRAVAAGVAEAAVLPPGAPLLRLTPESLVCSAVKPAEDGDGFVIRILNAGAAAAEARLDFGLPVDSVESVRLDETPDQRALQLVGNHVTLPIGAHGLRSLRIRTSPH